MYDDIGFMKCTQMSLLGRNSVMNSKDVLCGSYIETNLNRVLLLKILGHVEVYSRLLHDFHEQ